MHVCKTFKILGTVRRPNMDVLDRDKSLMFWLESLKQFYTNALIFILKLLNLQPLGIIYSLL